MLHSEFDAHCAGISHYLLLAIAIRLSRFARQGGDETNRIALFSHFTANRRCCEPLFDHAFFLLYCGLERRLGDYEAIWTWSPALHREETVWCPLTLLT